MNAYLSKADGHHTPADTPLTTTRVSFPNGTVELLRVPKGVDIHLAWLEFQRISPHGDSKAFLEQLLKMGIERATDVADVDLNLS